MSTETEQRRREELAAFLRSRRARVDRAALHLPPVARSRVPGRRGGRGPHAASARPGTRGSSRPARSVRLAPCWKRSPGCSGSRHPESDYLLRYRRAHRPAAHAGRFARAAALTTAARRRVRTRLPAGIQLVDRRVERGVRAPVHGSRLWNPRSAICSGSSLPTPALRAHAGLARRADGSCGEFRASAKPAIGTAELSDLVRRLFSASPGSRRSGRAETSRRSRRANAFRSPGGRPRRLRGAQTAPRRRSRASARVVSGDRGREARQGGVMRPITRPSPSSSG